MSNEGDQCNRLNESDVTEEQPTLNIGKLDASETGAIDHEDTIDHESQFDVTEEEPDYARDVNYQPDTDTDIGTATESETDAEKVQPPNVQSH